MSTREQVTGANVSTTTTPNPHEGLDTDVIITLSVLIPAALVAIFGGTGCFAYIQYRRQSGWKWGCYPCGNRGKKLKDSNESVSPDLPSAASGSGLATLSDKVETLGCGSVESLDNMAESELYSANAAAPAVLPKSDEDKSKGKKVKKRSNSDNTRSRAFYSREAKQNNEFDFDPKLTEKIAMTNKKK